MKENKIICSILFLFVTAFLIAIFGDKSFGNDCSKFQETEICHYDIVRNGISICTNNTVYNVLDNFSHFDYRDVIGLYDGYRCFKTQIFVTEHMYFVLRKIEDLQLRRPYYKAIDHLSIVYSLFGKANRSWMNFFAKFKLS